jgi:hypothetical protein
MHHGCPSTDLPACKKNKNISPFQKMDLAAVRAGLRSEKMEKHPWGSSEVLTFPR